MKNYIIRMHQHGPYTTAKFQYQGDGEPDTRDLYLAWMMLGNYLRKQLALRKYWMVLNQCKVLMEKHQPGTLPRAA